MSISSTAPSVLAASGSIKSPDHERSGSDSMRARYRYLFESPGSINLLLSPKGTILEVNYEGARALGVERHRLVGQNILEFIAPTDRGRVSELISSAFRHERFTSQEVDVESRGGLRRIVFSPGHRDLLGSAQSGAVLVSGSDITPQHGTKDAAGLRELHNAIYQSCSDAILLLDNDRVRDCNAQTTEVFGAAHGQVVARAFADLAPPRQPDGSESAERIRSALEEAARGDGPVHLEWTCQRPDGTRFEAELTLREVIAPDKTSMVAVLRDVSTHKALERRLRNMAIHDALTGLPNRRALLTRLDQACRSMHREPDAGERLMRCTLIRLNVDRFHLLNTSVGYAFGDEALMLIAERLRMFAAEHAGGLPACLGGDEFSVFLEGDVAGDAAAALMESLNRPLHIGGRQIHCSISMGVAEGAPGYSPQHLLRDAETALSRAERAGGARSIRFEPFMQKELEARALLESELRGAIDRGEIFTVFQPVVSLASGQPVGCEALLRWRHPMRGLIPPSEFIPIAEESDAIVRLGEFALARAAEQLAQIDAQTGLRLWMSVNLSKRQLHEQDLPQRLSKLAAQAGVNPARIKLEVTESIVMEDLDRVPAVLKNLKDLGFGLAMDDFGTGQSSLSCLRLFPVDTLKIDRAFISGVGPDRQYASVVNAIINLAHNLGMIVVAEGIEQRDQVAQLQTLDCDQGQGYLFSRPVEGGDLARVLGSLNGA